MPYIIDGHNLIPKVPGISLDALDDEQELIQLLEAWCRVQQKDVEVFFDNAPAGQPRVRSYGRVLARFVRAGTTADEAIRRKLQRLGGEAKNWTVVSSDHQVQRFARAAQAEVMSSAEFAARLVDGLEEQSSDPGEKPDAALAEDELDEWLDLFRGAEGDR